MWYDEKRLKFFHSFFILSPFLTLPPSLLAIQLRVLVIDSYHSLISSLKQKIKNRRKKKEKKTHGGMEPSPRNPHVVCFVRHLRHHLASVLVISRSRVCEKLASHDQATGWQTARRIGATSVGRPACRPAVTTQHVQQTATGDIRRVWKCAVSRRHCLK